MASPGPSKSKTLPPTLPPLRSAVVVPRAAMEDLGSGRPILTVHRNTFSPALTAAASRPSWRARSSVLLSACGQDCFMARHVSEDCPSLPSPRSQTDGLARRRSRRAGIKAPYAAICKARTKSSHEAPSPCAGKSRYVTRPSGRGCASYLHIRAIPNLVAYASLPATSPDSRISLIKDAF